LIGALEPQPAYVPSRLGSGPNKSKPNESRDVPRPVAKPQIFLRARVTTSHISWAVRPSRRITSWTIGSLNISAMEGSASPQQEFFNQFLLVIFPTP
jgi:hypothetical protein